MRGLFESRVMSTVHVSKLYFDGKPKATKKRLQKLKALGFFTAYRGADILSAAKLQHWAQKRPGLVGGLDNATDKVSAPLPTGKQEMLPTIEGAKGLLSPALPEEERENAWLTAQPSIFHKWPRDSGGQNCA